jgi:hypothetical protein
MNTTANSEFIGPESTEFKAKPKTPNFDRLAKHYRWMELFTFGPLLARCRDAFLPELATYPFNDPNLPMDKRIDNLLSLMTIEEKIDAWGRGRACRGWACRISAAPRGFTGGAARGAGKAPADHDDAVSAAAGDGRVVGSGAGARRRAAWKATRRGSSRRRRSTTARF